jgi:hypothetical protein
MKLPSRSLQGSCSPSCRCDYYLPLIGSTQVDTCPLPPQGFAEPLAQLLVDSGAPYLIAVLQRVIDFRANQRPLLI